MNLCFLYTTPQVKFGSFNFQWNRLHFSSATEVMLSNPLITLLECAKKKRRREKNIGRELQQFFYETVRWKWGFQYLTKLSFGVSIQTLSSFPSLRASTRQLLTSEMISKALWVEDCMSGHLWKGREKKVPYCSLALSLCLRLLSPFENWQKFWQWQ